MSNSTAEDKNTTMSAAPLFKSFEFGGTTLKNRIAMAPMTRGKSPNKIPGDAVADYYTKRAEGGVGLIITEGANPGHPASAGYPDVPWVDGEKAMEGWKKVIDGVHGAGSAIIPQIWHVGSIRQSGMEPDEAIPGFGPSAVVHPYFEGKEAEPPHEMTQKDIDETIEAFASAARQSKEIGFDGIELHGAHSYLIDQFFWKVTNQRNDKYGGDLVARTAFAVELIKACREAVGPDFPIVFRYSQWKQGDYAHKMAETPQDLEAFLGKLCDAGVDIFHASTRRFDDAEFEGSDLNLAGWSKKLTGKPAISVGSVGLDSDFLRSFVGKPSGKAGIDALIRRLERDEFDLVAVGRALLSDAEWGNKVRDGREEDIIEFTPAAMQEL
jgi:2,4-dienoyl-CoA reductase-like NADH-dependent reductase (Old Yellow Enzyme family)